jgi:hypothetical protein
MALFMDGPINGTADLQDYESSILTMAVTEGIDIASKMTLAQDELARQLLLFLLRVPMRDSKAAVRRVIAIRDVVITRPLKHCHALKSLALTYRDAYNSQLNDRYLGKWNEYERVAQEALEEYLQIGIGMVADPIPRGTGPSLTTIAGDGGAMTYYVATSWLNATGQEGALGDVDSIAVPDGTQVVVSTTNEPGNVSEWNVYAGTAADLITLQNGGPIPTGSSWTLPSRGLISGRPPGNGQEPDYFLFHDRRIQRG